ncbi:MAG: hypothetical protein KGL02_08980 [Acidobacteriota bacterium]|nr:hypothetical protein [Acidobacteriota bacterium]
MKLTVDPCFQPCPIEDGDECYPNGMFEFNITRLLAFIDAHADRFPIVQVALAELSVIGDSKLDPETMRTADLSRPIVLAEIAPNRYNVIDGHHRIGRARRDGVRSLSGRKIRCPEHLAFLTSALAYQRYVAYWNSKLGAPQATRRSRD